MITKILRRLLYALLVLAGVNLITFILFFFITTPDRMARTRLGPEATVEQIADWKKDRSYHLPYFFHDGWQEEDVKEVRGEGWIELCGLPRGGSALLIERAAATPPIQVLIASDPPGALSLGTKGGPVPPLPSSAAPPPGFTLLGAITTAAGSQTERTEHAVIAAGGARLAIRIAHSPPSGIVVRLLRHRPLGLSERLTQTVFYQRSLRFFWLDFGRSDGGAPIVRTILARIPPSLAITVPMFVLGLLCELSIAMLLICFRGAWWDLAGRAACVGLMSLSAMFYVIVGQWLFSVTLRWAPVSGFLGGSGAFRFVILPVAIGTVLGLGAGVRWYRALLIEELGKEYVRTARASGLPEHLVLLDHVLRNALVPIVTTLAAALPFLFTGSLVLESFFAIPGMGTFLLEALRQQDFATVQAMVFLGSALYTAGLLLTDLGYLLVDPRVRVGS